MASSLAASSDEYTEENVYDELKEFVTMFVEKCEKKLAEFKEEARVKGEAKTGTITGYASTFASIAGTLAGASSPVPGAGSALAQGAKVVTDQVVKSVSRNTHSRKAKKITKIFKLMGKYDRREILVNAAGQVFQSYESQFMQIEFSDGRGLEKLAFDAVDRAIYFIGENDKQDNPEEITSDLLAKGIIQGESKGFKPFNMDGLKTKTPLGWRTAHVFSKVGLYDVENQTYYTSKNCDTARYGYRLLLDSEHIPEKFTMDRDPKASSYKYMLTSDLLTEYIEKILAKIEKDDPEERDIRVDEGVKNIQEYQTEIKEGFKSLHDHIKKPIILTGKQTFFNVLMPVIAFTGRKNELETIRTKLEEGDRFKAVAISGLGGIGKSELAREYAYKYFKRDNAIWIDSETTEGMKTSFHDVAKQLGIKTTERRNQGEFDRYIQDIARDVYKNFLDRRYLLIFDNAESLNDIKGVLPWLVLPGVVSPYVLITSRCSDWGLWQDGNIEVINLNELSSEEAMIFVKKSLDIKNDNQKNNDRINEITQLVFCFPLALSQVVAYIKQKIKDTEKWGETYEISDYIRDYKSNNKDVKIELLTYPLPSDKYTKTMYTTLQLTFEKFKQMGNVGQMALKVLYVMAYLAPDNISVERYFLKENVDKMLLRNAVEKLEEYSIVRIHKGGVVSVHRLVQDVLQIWLEDQGQEENVLRNATNIEFSTKIFNKSYVVDRVHVKSLWKTVIKYKSLIRDFFLKTNNPYRDILIRHLAQSDMHEVIRAIIECLKENKIPTYDLRSIALSYAVWFGSKNVVKYLKPNHTQIILEAEIQSFIRYNDFNGLKELLEELETNPKRYKYLKLLNSIDLPDKAWPIHVDKEAGIKLLLDYQDSEKFDRFLLVLGRYEPGNILDIFNFFLHNSRYTMPSRAILQRALIEAIRANNFDSFKLILDYDPSLAEVCNNSDSIYRLLGFFGNFDILNLSLKLGPGVYKTGQDDDHLLVHTVRHGTLDMSKLILESTEVRVSTKVLQEALVIAFNQQDFENCELLKYHAAKLINDEEIDYYSLAKHSISAILDFLIYQDFDVNKPNKHGNVFLNCAAEYGNVQVCQFLIKHGANCNITDQYGKNALHSLFGKYFSYPSHYTPEKLKIYELLIDSGANVNATDIEGKTPLIYIIELMDDFEGPINDFVEYINDMYISIFRSLLKNGAKVNMTDHLDRTPWIYAANSKTPRKLELCNLLLQQGAAVDLNYPNLKGETFLFDVVREKHEQLFELLRDRGVDLNSKNKQNDTPLHIIARCGHSDFCKKFLENDIDLNIANDYGYTPLHNAIQYKHFEIFKILLNKGVCKEASKETWEFLFNVAIKHENSEVCKLFLESYINNKVNNDNVTWSNLIDILKVRSPIFIAVRFGFLSICEKLLELGEDIRGRNENAETLLHVAAFYNHFDVCQFLINRLLSTNTAYRNEEPVGQRSATNYINQVEHIPKILSNTLEHFRNKFRAIILWFPGMNNILSILYRHHTTYSYINALNIDVKTPLTFAIQNNCTKICELLLSHRADPNICDKNNISLLHYAAASDNISICKLLVDAEANVNVKIANKISKYSNIGDSKVQNGDTPLHVAAQYGNKNVCDLLFKFNADINACNEDFRTPLCLATLQDNYEICHLLLNLGANANVYDKNHESPLHLISEIDSKGNMNLGICEILIYFGADINAKNQIGNTPLNKAVVKKRTELCKVLLDFGADSSIANENGYTPMHSAVLNNDLLICKWLLSSEINVNVADKNGRTPLHLCAQRKKKHFKTEFPLPVEDPEATFDLNADQYDTSDSDADSKTTLEICERLLIGGANINTKDIYGKTSLYLAVFYGNFEICKLLLHYGANFNITDKDGLSPLELSKKRSNIHQLFINWKQTRQQLPAQD